MQESGIDLNFDDLLDAEQSESLVRITADLNSTLHHNTTTSDTVTAKLQVLIPTKEINPNNFYELKCKTPPQRSGGFKTATVMNRTNFKLQLMREEAELQARREAEQQAVQAQQRTLSSSAPIQTHSMKVPYTHGLSVEVPRQVLKVQTKLENPTRYHVLESQKRQVLQYLVNSGHDTTSAVSDINQTGAPNSASNSPSCGPLQSAPSATSPENSAPLSSTATSNTSEFDLGWHEFSNLDTVEASEAIMESDGFNLLETFSNLSSTLPQGQTDTSLLDHVIFSPSSKVSASCPPDIQKVKQERSFSEVDIHAWAKDRQKKDNHNKIERRRRFNINDRIKELGTLLPKSNDPFSDLVKDLRQNKGTILKASVEYVKALKKEVDKIPALEDRNRQMEQYVKKLLLRIQELEVLLQNHGIPVTEMTWQPSSETDLSHLMNRDPVPGVVTSTSTDCKPSNVLTPIKQELCCSPSPTPSSGLSPAQSTTSPGPAVAPYDDFLMDDDRTPVNGDPFMSSSHHIDDEVLSPTMDY